MALPSLSPSGSCLVELVSFAQPTRLLSSCGKTPRFAVLKIAVSKKFVNSDGGNSAYLVDWLDNPIDPGVPTDGLVLRVHKDDLKILVGGILVDPVGVEDSQVCAATTDSFFGGGFE